MRLLFTILLFSFVTESKAQFRPILDTTAEKYCELGEIYVSKKQYQTAFAYFSKAITKKPTAKFYCKRGSCLLLQNKSNEAIKDFDNSINIDKSYSEAYFFKGTVYQFNADSKNAIINYTKAIECNKTYSDAYLMRAMTYGSIDKTKEACSDLNMAAKLGNKKAIEQLPKLCK